MMPLTGSHFTIEKHRNEISLFTRFSPTGNMQFALSCGVFISIYSSVFPSKTPRRCMFPSIPADGYYSYTPSEKEYRMLSFTGIPISLLTASP